MAEINIELKEYVNAKDGSLLIRKNGKWVLTNFEELNKENQKKLSEIDNLKIELKAVEDNAKHYVVYAKSHFLVVFNYYKIKILAGEIDYDEELVGLDEKVISDEISVEEAVNKNDFIKSVYEKLYLNNKELKEFPEV